MGNCWSYNGPIKAQMGQHCVQGYHGIVNGINGLIDLYHGITESVYMHRDLLKAGNSYEGTIELCREYTSLSLVFRCHSIYNLSKSYLIESICNGI